MARFVEDRSGESLFVSGSLDSLLPANSVARLIHGTLAEALWRQITHNLLLLTGQWQPMTLTAQQQGPGAVPNESKRTPYGAGPTANGLGPLKTKDNERASRAILDSGFQRSLE